MLSSYWVLITVLLFVAGFVFHQPLLFLIAVLFFLSAGAARLWGHYCLKRLDYKQQLSAHRVFFGEEVELNVEISNNKPLPLPWIQIDDELPKDVQIISGKTSPSYMSNRVILTNLSSMNWYHRIKRRYHFKCLQRGYFQFGPTKIQSGDVFGFFKREVEINNVEYLTVYPKLLPLQYPAIPSKQPSGDIRVKNTIFQDPILTKGIRDYQYGDGLKHIHWKSTARLGALKTKEFEPTTTTDFGIFLDVRTLKLPFWGNIPDLFELAIITTASLANSALTKGYRVGLYINYGSMSSFGSITIAPSQHPDQLLNMLEALAQINAIENTPIAALIQQESCNLSWGSTILVVSAAPSDELLITLIELMKAGRSVALVIIGEQQVFNHPDDLPVYYVPDTKSWRDLDEISIVEI